MHLFQHIDVDTFDVKKAIRSFFHIIQDNGGEFRFFDSTLLASDLQLCLLDYQEFQPISGVIHTPNPRMIDGIEYPTGYIELAFNNFANANSLEWLNECKSSGTEIDSASSYDVIMNQKELFGVSQLSKKEIHKLAHNILLTIPFETRDDINFVIKVAYDYMKLYPKSFLVIYMAEEVFFLEDLKLLHSQIIENDIDLAEESKFLKINRKIKAYQKPIDITEW